MIESASDHKHSSLRTQINVRIAISSLLVLILGTILAIWQTRNAVRNEIESSTNLALNLIKMATARPFDFPQNESEWLKQLRTLEETRHLQIRLKEPKGDIYEQNTDATKIGKDNLPAWFIRLVADAPPEIEYKTEGFDGGALTLLIRAEPLDEISEIWQESLIFLLLLILITLLTFLSVNLVFNRSLYAINQIIEGLKTIESGDYRHLLPEFSNQEFNNIARAIDHMNHVLNTTQEENRSLTQHSLQIQEEERKRLAQELHDELGQSLTAIKVMAVTAGQKQTGLSNITASIAKLCDHLMTVVRSMMQQLHPMMLTDLGLQATLEDTVSHWSKLNPGLDLALHCSGTIDKVDYSIGIQVFRIVQECLTNVVRHANASRVDITLKLKDKHPGMITLQITDNGVGCNIDSISTGFGLRSMRERIKSMKGKLTLDSQENAGLTIFCQIPVTS